MDANDRSLLKAVIRAAVLEWNTIPVPAEHHSNECASSDMCAPCSCSPVMLTEAQLDLYDSCVLEVAEELLTSGVSIAQDLYTYAQAQGCCRIPEGKTVSPELLKWTFLPDTTRARSFELVCNSGELVAH